MSHFDSRSVSSRSTASAFPSSTTSVSHGSGGKKEPGFVAPNSRRGGRDFKVVHKQKSDASTSVDKKDKSGKGFRRVLGELIAGRSNARNSVVREEVETTSAREETSRPRIGNKTSEWVQQEAKRSQLRERELRRHEAAMAGSGTSIESLDDGSFYASDVRSDSDGFPAPPPRRHYPLSDTSLSTFPNLSQLSLRDSLLELSPPPIASSRNSTLLTPTALDPASRRLSSRSSPQLRPLLLPSTLPTGPLPPLPHHSSAKVLSFLAVSLPATPPASPPVEPLPFREFSRSSTSSSLPGSSDSDSLLAPSPSVQRTAPHRHSFLAPANSLGLAVTTAAPLVTSSIPAAPASALQKKLDTTTRMLLKALAFDLAYLVKVSLPVPPSSARAARSSFLPAVPTLEILSSSGMPRPEPKFDPELHLSALRSATGLLFHSPGTEPRDRTSYKTGLLMPIVATRKVGYVLCAFTRDEAKEVGERELRWVAKFAEELEDVVVGLGVRP
ncbi:hypothetical protein JCM11491_007207 [Sporobolomyces phaffii]